MAEGEELRLPSVVKAKNIQRLDELITEGEGIVKATRTVEKRHNTWIGERRGHPPKTTTQFIVDFERFIEWKEDCLVFLSHIIHQSSPHHRIVIQFERFRPSHDHVRAAVRSLKSVRKNLNMGYLLDYRHFVASWLEYDFLAQAEMLLDDKSNDHQTHVAATVIAGAVLENALRVLCQSQNPPLQTEKGGRNFTLGPLIDNLAKEDVIDKVHASKLRTWSTIRNRAAHGEFSKLNRNDVRDMVEGVKAFVHSLAHSEGEPRESTDE